MESLTENELVNGTRRLISLGYYDGTTSGIIRLDASGAAYRYELVSWDADQDVRVFCLSVLQPSAFDKATELLSQLGNPKWPCWYPVWKFPSREQQSQTEQRLKEAIGERFGPCVTSVLCHDLCDRISGVIRLDGESLALAEEFSRTGVMQPLKVWLPFFGSHT